MKLNLRVPVERVQVGPNVITFRHELREVEVQAVTRRPADFTARRWHYTAHFDHPDAHPDAPRVGISGSLIEWIRRADHPRWVPPEFPPGKNSVVLVATGQEGTA